MRFLFILLACATLLAGYPAECHAFGLEDCASVEQAQGNCDRADSGKSSGEAQCLDCAECCSPTVASAPKSFVPSLRAIPVYSPGLAENSPQGRIFSLLRPPTIA